MKSVKCGARSAGRQREGGFTLIEIIVTIVIVSILASMLYSYFGTAITRSADPLMRMGNALTLQQVMENITADYKSLYNPATKQFNLAALRTSVGTVGTTIIASSSNYGSYNVIENGFIKFTNYIEDTNLPGDNLLKVTVKNTATGETLTVLFSKS